MRPPPSFQRLAGLFLGSLLGFGGPLACSPVDHAPIYRDGIEVGPIQSFEAERAPGSNGIWSVWDSSASDNHALGLYASGTATVPLELVTTVSGLIVRLRGEDCEGPPEIELSVDGILRLKTEVKNTRWVDYPVVVHLEPGMHRFDFRFPNDKYNGPKCDRNLFVDKVTFINAGAVNRGPLRAVSMLILSGAQTLEDPRVAGGKVEAFMSEGVATGQTELLTPAAGLAIGARGEMCKGPPDLQVSVDGLDRGTYPVTSPQWTQVWVPVALTAGVHSISVAFTNDKYEGPGCDRNLFLSEITPLPAPPPPVAQPLPPAGLGAHP